MFNPPDMASGYTSIVKDIEHSSEPSADTITPMLFLRPDDPKWLVRAVRISEMMRDVWTGKNQRGQMMFKNITLCPSDRLQSQAGGTDTTLSTRQPAIVYWQQSKDPQLGGVLGPLLDTWLDATARAENGKPAGIVPSAIHWPDGTVGNPKGKWWVLQSASPLTTGRAMSPTCSTPCCSPTTRPAMTSTSNPFARWLASVRNT
ncbi:MAG: hypothetical protein QM760_15115 [Nibricoccus sp.]